jgi:hypothetical protein
MGTLGEPAAAAGDLARPAAAAQPSVAVAADRAGGRAAAPPADSTLAAAHRRAGRPHLGLVALLAVLAAWGGWLIARSSFVVQGRRVFCLFDDAMITMTYARNLLEGHGLNWARQGAPVEGFTHPLWLLLMLPANAPAIELSMRSLVVQVLSLVLLASSAAAAWRLMRTHFAPPAAPEAPYALPAAALTAFYYPLAYWSVMGMETALQALLLLAVVQLALDAVFAGRDRHLPLWLACSAAYLLRMDMLLLVVVAQGYLLAMGGLRPAGRRSWWVGAGCFLAAALGYEIFRWIYFHDLLPNTYYLKLTGIPPLVRLRRGVAAVSDFAASHALLLALVALVAIVRRRDRKLWLPLALFGTCAAYVVWVGGDAWEDIGVRADRFVAFAMPLLFVVLNAGLDATLAAWARRRGAGATAALAASRLSTRALAVLATVGLWLAANGLASPASAGWNWALMSGLERPPLARRHQRVVALLGRFQRFVSPEATVATAWAGVPAFFSDYRMVDLLGYNDRHLARLPSPLPLVPERYWELVPGHAKWDVRHALERARPDAFFQIWGIRALGGSVERVMRQHGYRRYRQFWLRADSPWIGRAARRPSAVNNRSRSKQP